MELARYADVIWDARNSKKTVVAAVQPATVEEETTHGEETALDRAVAALTIHAKKKWQEEGWRTFQWRPGGRKRRRPEPENPLRQA